MYENQGIRILSAGRCSWIGVPVGLTTREESVIVCPLNHWMPDDDVRREKMLRVSGV